MTKKQNSKSGFTLIELLVVISIIAILAVIGAASFAGVQARARDARRRVELEAIASVLEIHRTTAGYQPITTDQFAGAVFPGGSASYALDPLGYPYCITTDLTDSLSVSDFSSVPSCDATGVGNTFTFIDGTTPQFSPPAYKVCTRLERSPPASRVLCRNSQQ